MKNDGLSCTNLSYTHQGSPAFSGISFTLDNGNILLIQGDNGSGKTTLLRLLAAILQPQNGEIRLAGERISEINNYGLKSLYIGHKPSIKPALTPRDMIRFWSKIYRTEELQEAAMHYFELDRYADMPCETLSAGWRQRVSLSRLILSPARLWLLDEPASHLDSEGSSLLQSLIMARKEQGGLVVMAMHGHVEAENVQKLILGGADSAHPREGGHPEAGEYTDISE